MRKLTDIKNSILLYVTEHQDEHGYAPTVREIGDKVGLSSSSTVHNHIHSLIEMGYLSNDLRSPRTLKVVSGSAPEKHILEQMKELDDDQTDIVYLQGQPFLVKRASLDDIKEWAGAQNA
ncbi:LexA family protein [Halobacillus salinus]|uniref:LexA family protein n=1 Tax=Halobacillus salinus TaxID=192814 RepID=UPI0009A5F770|nr:helix-turn-helix domain-containing protein [Halobacillus salinus]